MSRASRHRHCPLLAADVSIAMIALAVTAAIWLSATAGELVILCGAAP